MKYYGQRVQSQTSCIFQKKTKNKTQLLHFTHKQPACASVHTTFQGPIRDQCGAVDPGRNMMRRATNRRLSGANKSVRAGVHSSTGLLSNCLFFSFLCRPKPSKEKKRCARICACVCVCVRALEREKKERGMKKLTERTSR